MVLRRQGPRVRACSFCGLDASQVSSLIAGPSVHICGDCVALCTRIVEGETGARFEVDGDDDARLVGLRATGAAVDALADRLHAQVADLRERGVSWQRIAEALGMSRQAAWERFR